jgi:hypothetical protein
MVANPIRRDDGSTRRQQTGTQKLPSDRQAQILRALAWSGNAAAVGRELNTHEGHVRRLARQFPEH